MYDAVTCVACNSAPKAVVGAWFGRWDVPPGCSSTTDLLLSPDANQLLLTQLVFDCSFCTDN